MDTALKFAAVSARIKSFITRQEADEEGFNQLALELFGLQFENVLIFHELCLRRGATPATVRRWEEIPAMPTEAFKEFEVTSLAPEERTAVFYSSGTTTENRSRHFHSGGSLAMYEDSLLPWFERHFLPDKAKMALVSLTPPIAAAPHSSLVHMFDTVARTLPWNSVEFFGRVLDDGAWEVAGKEGLHWLREATGPVAIVGTAYSFVHLADARWWEPVKLPAGSRVLETGGYKGRSREMSKPELRRLISRSFGIHSSRIISEYGMSELSSQAYGGSVGNPPEAFHFPPWARAMVISPETGREVAEGETGLLRIFDLANARSVLAVQTGDLARRQVGGFELLGRAPAAEARGCSLMSV